MTETKQNVDIIEKLVQIAHLLIQGGNQTHTHTKENTRKLNEAIEMSRGISPEILDEILHINDSEDDGGDNSNSGLNNETRILRKVMLGRSRCDEILRTQPDYEMLACSARILTGLPSEIGSREEQHEYRLELNKAINLSRNAIDALMPAIIKDMSCFRSCPIQDLASCSMKDNRSINLKRLGHIPAGHVIAGYDRSANEIIRGTVDTDYVITWVYGLAAQRCIIANEVLNQALNDNGYIMRDKSDWTSDTEGMACYLDMMEDEGVRDIENIYVTLKFSPDSPQILSAELSNEWGFQKNIFSRNYEHDDLDFDDCPEP